MHNENTENIIYTLLLLPYIFETVFFICDEYLSYASILSVSSKQMNINNNINNNTKKHEKEKYNKINGSRI